MLASPPCLLPGVGFASPSGPAPLQILVVPRHLAHKIPRNLRRGGSRRNQMRRVAHLCHFRKHHRRPRAHQQVGRKPHRGIRRHARKRIRPSALHADYQVGRRTRHTPPLVQPLELLLGQRHDRGHHLAKALRPHPAARRPTALLQAPAAPRRHHPHRLQFFAAQAHHHHFAAEVRMQRQVAQRANGNGRARRIDSHSAAVRMRDRDHVIHVRIARQNLRLDAPHRKIHRRRHALHRGADAENVFRPHRSVGIAIALKRVALKRRQAASGVAVASGQSARGGASGAVINPSCTQLPRAIGAIRVADGHAVAHNGIALGKIGERNLVRFRHRFAQAPARTRTHCPQRSPPWFTTTATLSRSCTRI